MTALAQDTHKFESRYLDSLIGPFPAAKSVYEGRSPLNHLDGFKAPLIVLQGADDPVVPPNQSERIVDALRKRHVPVAYLLFPANRTVFANPTTSLAHCRLSCRFTGRFSALPRQIHFRRWQSKDCPRKVEGEATAPGGSQRLVPIRRFQHTIPGPTGPRPGSTNSRLPGAARCPHSRPRRPCEQRGFAILWCIPCG